MENVTWKNEDGEITIVKLPPDDESFGSSWYARDFVEFMTSIVWDAYPSLRPLVKRAADSCFTVWEKMGMYTDPFYHRRYSKWVIVKHYFSSLNWGNAGRFLSDLASGDIFRVGEEWLLN